MTNKQFESQQDKFKRIYQLCVNDGQYSDEKYSIEVLENHTIWVTELRNGKKVAYSSTKADFEPSLTEFVADFFM